MGVGSGGQGGRVSSGFSYMVFFGLFLLFSVFFCYFSVFFVSPPGNFSAYALGPGFRELKAVLIKNTM